MTLLFISEVDEAATWHAELRRQMPGLEVRVWPEAGRLEEVRYALVWRAQPGVLAGLPNLRAVFSLGAGVDALVGDATLPPDVPLVRMVLPSLAEAMTEYVVQQVLDWHRQAPLYRAQQRARLWQPLSQPFARERRVGILGLGQLGSDAARALQALRFEVAGWTRQPRSVPGVAGFHGSAGLAPFLARCDVLVCLLPLTRETTGLLNWETLAALPRGAFLINAARGRIVVENDLLASLDSFHLAGAALDVFADEPLPPDHPFWSHPNVVVTPHVAAATDPRTGAERVAANIRAIEAGQPVEHVVDRRRGY